LLSWGAGEKGGALALYVRNADGTPFEGQDLIIEDGKTTEGNPLDLSTRWAGASPISKDHVTELAVPGGKSGMLLWNKAGKEPYVDAYCKGGAFYFPNKSPENAVIEPSMARQAISVGSYDWSDQFNYRGEQLTLVAACGGLIHIGELSCYSSIGPGRDPN